MSVKRLFRLWLGLILVSQSTYAQTPQAVGRMSDPATRSNGEQLTADELLGDPRFALD